MYRNNTTHVTKRVLANELRKAANLLVERGWVQRYFFNRNGFCMIGAINALGSTNVCAVKLALGSYMRELNIHASPVRYNDKPGRTKEDVLRLMRGAAAALEHGLKVR